MIIEGAFLKLPELLLGHTSPRSQYEATLTNHLAIGVLLELSARNIGLPMHKIHIEKPYPNIDKNKSPGRTDLYVDLEGVFTRGLWYDEYGMKKDNWIEAKYFGGIGRQIGSQTKTENAAMIALDIFRLCLFVKEERSKYRENGRFLILVFNREPKKYLAFSRQNSSKREWLNFLLQPGQNFIEIKLEKEPNSFKRTFGNGFVNFTKNLYMNLRVFNYSFEPIECKSEFLYWGFLIRIVDFEISLNDEELIYKDISEETWSEKKLKTQKRLVEKYLNLQ